MIIFNENFRFNRFVCIRRNAEHFNIKIEYLILEKTKKQFFNNSKTLSLVDCLQR